MRVVGVSPADLTGWRTPGSGGKWAGVFRALQAHFDVVEVLRADPPPLARAMQLAGKALRLAPPRWDPKHFHSRTARLERRLRAWDGRFDLIFQMQTLCAPGTGARPYAICTDSTHALMRRHDVTAPPIRGQEARQRQRLEREVMQGAQVVLTWSEFARRSIIDDYGCDPGRVVTVGAGANFVVDEVPDRRGSPPVALFVGSDEFARKGGPVLLEAWAEVERRVAGSRLVIAGPRRPIQSRAREVQWVGRVPRQDLAAYYRSASVFVLPSLFEPLGLVLLEAMGYGLPCVASNCCAMPELVADGRTGLLTPPGDAAALADALVRLLSDPDLAAALGRAGHRELVARHTWDHVGQRMARAIETRRGRDAAAPRPLSVRATRPG